VGPTSAEEARVLREDGLAAYQHEEWAKALPFLRRYVDRYPGQPQYAEMKVALARTYLGLRRPEDSLKALHGFVEALPEGSLRTDARVLTARAQLQAHHYPEALLSAQTLSREDGLPPAAQMESLGIQARALIALSEDSRAEIALASLRKLDPTRTEGYSIELELKLRQCAKFPGPPPLEEAATRDQLARRGDCLQEALLIARKAPEPLLLNSWIAGWRNYREAIRRPPPPPGLRPHDRDRAQKRAYARELSFALKQDLRARARQILELAPELTAVQAEIRPDTLAAPGERVR
jgi:hypothetical protein